MGRKSLLTEDQWASIGKDIAKGDSISVIAAKFKVSRAAIYSKFPTLSEMKGIAESLALAESVVEALPKCERVVVRSLADQLKDVAYGLSKAAASGSRVAAILAARAERRAKTLGDDFEDGELGQAQLQLKTIHALHTTANEASRPGIELLKLSKAGPADPTLAPPAADADFSGWSDEDLNAYLALGKKYAK